MSSRPSDLCEAAFVNPFFRPFIISIPLKAGFRSFIRIGDHIKLRHWRFSRTSLHKAAGHRKPRAAFLDTIRSRVEVVASEEDRTPRERMPKFDEAPLTRRSRECSQAGSSGERRFVSRLARLNWLATQSPEGLYPRDRSRRPASCRSCPTAPGIKGAFDTTVTCSTLLVSMCGLSTVFSGLTGSCLSRVRLCPSISKFFFCIDGVGRE
jgi:hypothetical protein